MFISHFKKLGIAMGVVVMASLMAHGQEPISSHKIYINGTQVTSNADATDILKDGTLSYNIDSRTLTLNNARLVNVGKTAAIEFKDSEHDYAIRLVGNNSITTAGGGISHLCNLSIKGDTLKCTSSNNKSTAIWVRNGKTLTIKDCDLVAQGWNGIGGTKDCREKMIVSNAHVVAQGFAPAGAQSGAAIRQLSSLDMNGCGIILPQEAAFDKALHGVALNQKLCMNVEISQQSSVPVSYEDIGNAQVVAIYDLAGRLLASPQQGLNILKMSDGRVIKVMK